MVIAAEETESYPYVLFVGKFVGKYPKALKNTKDSSHIYLLAAVLYILICEAVFCAKTTFTLAYLVIKW